MFYFIEFLPKGILFLKEFYFKKPSLFLCFKILDKIKETYTLGQNYEQLKMKSHNRLCWTTQNELFWGPVRVASSYQLYSNFLLKLKYYIAIYPEKQLTYITMWVIL